MTSTTPSSRTKRARLLMILGMTVFFIASYVVTVALYHKAGCGCPRQLTEGRAAADGTSVTIDIEDLQTVKGTLTGRVTITPGAGLLDPATHGLKEELSIAVHSAVTPTKRTWAKGMVPGEFPVPLTVSGNSANWPFDHYETGPITVDVLRGDSPAPERISAIFVDHIAGWKNEITGDEATGGPYRVTLHRSPSTVAFGAVVVGVLVALAAVGVVVALLTFGGWRKFQPPMTTWYAAMLFAVVPLREALPDAPPIGSWIDVTVTLWVIVALVMSMLLFIFCWWRDLKPDPVTQA